MSLQGEKRREQSGPNEIVACTSCGSDGSPCTHSAANNGCATEVILNGLFSFRSGIFIEDSPESFAIRCVTRWCESRIGTGTWGCENFSNSTFLFRKEKDLKLIPLNVICFDVSASNSGEQPWCLGISTVGETRNITYVT